MVMQRLFSRLDERLRTFVRQRRSLLLLVPCRDEAAAFLLKAIQGFDESSDDVVWAFHESFGDAASYVEAIVAAVRSRQEALNAKFAAVGERPFPPLPPRVTGATAAPFVRLQTLFLYLRRRIPSRTARLVVALVPSEVRDPLRWRLLLREMTEYDRTSPWCHHVRVVAREPERVAWPDAPRDLHERADSSRFPSTEVHPFDLGPDALRDAVREEIADPEQPLAARAQALLTDAMLDYADRRYAPALEKYALLRELYAHVGNAPMLALALNGIGECYARVGRLDEAVPYFERAVTPAAESGSHPILLNVSLNLANSHFESRRWPLALEQYVATEKLATAMLQATVKLGCLENIGVCRLQLGNAAGAERTWRDGVALASGVKEEGARLRFLERLRALYADAGLQGRLRAVERELRGIA